MIQMLGWESEAPQGLKPECFLSFNAGLKACSTPTASTKACFTRGGFAR